DLSHLYFNVLGSLAVGWTHEAATIAGSTTLVPSGGTPVTLNGGLLALTSNIGRTTHDEVTLVPELGVTLGWHVFKWMDVFAGYNFLYWSDVERPGDKVDRVVNPTLLPTSVQGNTGFTGPVRPAGLQQTDFWVHGVSGGLAFRF